MFGCFTACDHMIMSVADTSVHALDLLGPAD